MIHSSWQNYLSGEFEKPYMKELLSFVESEYASGKKIYPPQNEIFSAFEYTPFDQVKVVIVGQDPYHGEGQAHGLLFSVKPGVKIPPSLRNIYKEIESDLGLSQPTHGYLESWAKQGVFLLNTVLTVEEGKPGSHRKKGWEIFTDKVIETLNEKNSNLVFVLWGSFAQGIGEKIDRDKHLVLTAAHPSPLSAYRGFFGCKHFSKINQYLESVDKEAVDWSVK